MRWLPLALCFALAACDSDPCLDASCVTLTPDAGDAGQVPDVSATTDRPDVGKLAPDVVAVADVATVDVGEDVVDVPVVDVVAVADAGVDAAVDAGGDVVGVDVVDVPPVDVPRDAGAVDAGGVVYDLDVGRAALEAHFAGRRTLPPPTSTSRECPDDASAVTCSVAGGVLNFNLGACYGTSLTARFVLGDAGASTLSIHGGGGGSFARVLRFATGSRIGGRRSFHVQFSAPPFQAEPGFDGVPGRTVDPALADLWLLGCASD
jgi:hypothetical protein